MPQIDVNQRLYEYLKRRSAVAHDGDINAFLYSMFSLHVIREDNADRRILKLIDIPEYKNARNAKDKYILVLRALHQIDEIKFATLNNFRPPNWERVILSNLKSTIEKSTTSEEIEPVPGTEYWCLLGFSAKHYQDFAFHLMRAMYYPHPVATAIKKSVECRIFNDDLFELLGI